MGRSQESVNWTYVRGLPESATDGQIRSRYRKLAKQYHPDRWATADPQTKAKATEKMRRLNHAHEAANNAVHSQPRHPPTARSQRRATTSPRRPSPHTTSTATSDVEPVLAWSATLAGPAPRRR